MICRMWSHMCCSFNAVNPSCCTICIHVPQVLLLKTLKYECLGVVPAQKSLRMLGSDDYLRASIHNQQHTCTEFDTCEVWLFILIWASEGLESIPACTGCETLTCCLSITKQTHMQTNAVMLIFTPPGNLEPPVEPPPPMDMHSWHGTQKGPFYPCMVECMKAEILCLPAVFLICLQCKNCKAVRQH